MVFPLLLSSLKKLRSCSKVGRARDLLPGVEFGLQQSELFTHQINGIAAQKKMGRRVIGGNDLQDGLCGFPRIAGLLAAAAQTGFTKRLEDLVVIGNLAFGANHRPTRPIGAEATGFDSGDMNAEAPDFLAEAFGNSLEG